MVELTPKIVVALENNLALPKKFSTYADVTAYTHSDITQPGDKLGNSSGAPERAKWENNEIMLFS